mmetsp:Transcript_58889/g.158658  ORF Transcript_58889/g.158658 Transcript_58889/m.158658 type:complete len:348 (-) Transcript_58889:49-1092(-)
MTAALAGRSPMGGCPRELANHDLAHELPRARAERMKELREARGEIAARSGRRQGSDIETSSGGGGQSEVHSPAADAALASRPVAAGLSRARDAVADQERRLELARAEVEQVVHQREVLFTRINDSHKETQKVQAVPHAALHEVQRKELFFTDLTVREAHSQTEERAAFAGEATSHMELERLWHLKVELEGVLHDAVFQRHVHSATAFRPWARMQDDHVDHLQHQIDEVDAQIDYHQRNVPHMQQLQAYHQARRSGLNRLGLQLRPEVEEARRLADSLTNWYESQRDDLEGPHEGLERELVGVEMAVKFAEQRRDREQEVLERRKEEEREARDLVEAQRSFLRGFGCL